jgi:hypothetical protein
MNLLLDMGLIMMAITATFLTSALFALNGSLAFNLIHRLLINLYCYVPVTPP